MPLVTCKLAVDETCVVKGIADVCNGAAEPEEFGFGASGREKVGALEAAEVGDGESVGALEGAAEELGLGVA